MLHELCIPLTMKAMAAGHPLYEAQCIAAVLIFELVLFCTLAGFRIVPPEATGPDREAFPTRGRVSYAGTGGIFTVVTGTAGLIRALLPY